MLLTASVDITLTPWAAGSNDTRKYFKCFYHFIQLVTVPLRKVRMEA